MRERTFPATYAIYCSASSQPIHAGLSGTTAPTARFDACLWRIPPKQQCGFPLPVLQICPLKRSDASHGSPNPNYLPFAWVGVAILLGRRTGGVLPGNWVVLQNDPISLDLPPPSLFPPKRKATRPWTCQQLTLCDGGFKDVSKCLMRRPLMDDIGPRWQLTGGRPHLKTLRPRPVVRL